MACQWVEDLKRFREPAADLFASEPLEQDAGMAADPETGEGRLVPSPRARASRGGGGGEPGTERRPELGHSSAADGHPHGELGWGWNRSPRLPWAYRQRTATGGGEAGPRKLTNASRPEQPGSRGSGAPRIGQSRNWAGCFSGRAGQARQGRRGRQGRSGISGRR